MPLTALRLSGRKSKRFPWSQVYILCALYFIYHFLYSSGACISRHDLQRAKSLNSALTAFFHASLNQKQVSVYVKCFQGTQNNNKKKDSITVYLLRQMLLCEHVSTTNSQQILTKCSLYTCVYWGDKLVQICPKVSLGETI